MQINSIQSNYQPNFQAKVSRDFVNATRNYISKTGDIKKMDSFLNKVEKFKTYGNNDIKIIHQKKFIDGKKQHVLFATTDGMQPEDYVVITIKDKFRKVVEKFLHINEYEFEMKAGNLL